MNAHDRCDGPGCPAAAMVRVRKVVTNEQLEQIVGELDFCGHHSNKYADSLDAQGFFTVARREEAVPA
jgi:hypothetical protein